MFYFLWIPYNDLNNTLWVATNNGTIKIALHNESVAAKDFKFSYYINDQFNPNSLDNNRVNVILKDKENTVWVSTDGKHLNRYNSSRDNFERVLIKSKKPYELNHVPKRLFIDKDGYF